MVKSLSTTLPAISPHNQNQTALETTSRQMPVHSLFALAATALSVTSCGGTSAIAWLVGGSAIAFIASRLRGKGPQIISALAPGAAAQALLFKTLERVGQANFDAEALVSAMSSISAISPRLENYYAGAEKTVFDRIVKNPSFCDEAIEAGCTDFPFHESHTKAAYADIANALGWRMSKQEVVGVFCKAVLFFGLKPVEWVHEVPHTNVNRYPCALVLEVLGDLLAETSPKRACQAYLAAKATFGDHHPLDKQRVEAVLARLDAQMDVRAA